MDDIQKKLHEYSPYLEDLLKRVYFLTIFFVGAFIVSLVLSTPMIRFFTHVFDFSGVVLATTSPFQLLDLAMSISMFSATVLTIPVFLYNLYAFIGSGLREGEKNAFFLVLPLGLGLFAFGFAYSFYVSYFAMQAIANINTGLGVQNLWDITTFLSQIISTSALLGVVFEFPIIVTLLVKTEVITASFLKEKRRMVIFGLCAFTALLPPTDGISLLLMVLPLIVLYEATIIYNSLLHKAEDTIINT